MPDYALEGPSWSNPDQITYAWGAAGDTFEGGAPNPDGGNQFTNAITGAYQAMVRDALAAWSAVANVTFVAASSTSGADLDFGWMNYTTPDQVGVTDYTSHVDGTKQVFVTGTFVGFEDPAYKYVGSDQSAIYSGTNTTLYQVMLHEIGHALGLAHSDNAATLMDPYLGPDNRGITQADATGMQLLYGAPGSVRPTPVPTTTISGIAIADDTGVPGDFITNNPHQGIGATLSAPLASNEHVLASVDGGATWTDITAGVLGQQVVWRGVTIAGSNDIEMKVTNANGDGAVAIQHYVLDTTPPTTTVAGIRISDDTGVAGDLVTKDATQTITATLSNAPDAGDRVMGSTDNGNHWTDVTAMVSGTSIQWTGATLVGGSNAIAFQVVDIAGNAGQRATLAYVLDQDPPGKPTATLGDWLGPDGKTATVDGTAQAGSTVVLLDSDGQTVLGEATSSQFGTYSISSSPLSAGTHRLTVDAIDLAGNASQASDPMTALVGMTGPTLPLAPILSFASDSGVKDDDLTNVATPTVFGIGAANGTVQIYDDTTGTIVGTGAANSSGTYAIATTTLADGMHALYARETDADGNQGAPSPLLWLTIDATAPGQPSAPALAPGSDAGSRTPTLVGQAEAWSTVSLYDTDGSTILGTGTASADGSYSIASATLAAGTHMVTARATDAAGNASGASAAATIAIADPVPVTPVPAPTPVTPIQTPEPVTPIQTPEPVTPIQTPEPDPIPAQTPTIQHDTVKVVYRFFDSQHGTQFLTSDAGERDRIIATRHDLTFEGKAMGSVNADPSNPNVAEVFRFFDGSNGTHFFTTSAGERDNIVANRHDMVLEQANLFEHATKQAGDVAVYRFFNTGDGSHFFTSNAGEIAAITTGRHDMVAEGVAFYSPSV